MRDQKQIGSAFIWNHAGKIAGYGLDLLLSIILARGLGAYAYGIWSELYTLIFLFSMLSSFGLDTSANVYVPKYHSPAKLSAFLRFSLTTFVLLSLLSLLLMNGASQQWSQWLDSPLSGYIAIASLYMVFLAWSIWMNALLISFYDLRFSFFLNIGFKSTVCIGAFFLLRYDYGIKALLYLMTAAMAIVILLFAVRHAAKFKAASEAIDRMKIWRFNVAAWLTKFLNYLLGRYSDIFILGVFAVVNEEIAYFNLAFSLTMALFYLFTAGFGGVSLTLFSDAVNRNQIQRLQQGWNMILKVIILFCLPVFLFSILYADAIMILLYSADFIAAAPLFRVFALFYLVSILCGAGVNSAVLYAFEKQNTVLRLRAVFGVANIVLDIALIHYLGVMGAIIATGISTVAIIACELMVVARQTEMRYPFLFLFKVLAGSVAALGFVFLFIPSSGPVVLLFRGMAYLLALSIGLALLKPLDKRDHVFIDKAFHSVAVIIKPFVSV